MVSPCVLAAAATLATTRSFFSLHCTLLQIKELEEHSVYSPELFDGRPCGMACATTAMDTIGSDAVSVDNTLYSAQNAANTIDAIISSHHCRCRIKGSVFSIGCDCTLWAALHEQRWGPTTPSLAVEFQKRLDAAAAAAEAVRADAAVLKQLATYELKHLCAANGTVCPDSGLLQAPPPPPLIK